MLLLLVVACSLSDFLLKVQPQKLVFIDTPDGISTKLRPYWSEALKGRAGVVQAQVDMLEIIPVGSSKGSGVKLLLEHLNTTPKEVLFFTNLSF